MKPHLFLLVLLLLPLGAGKTIILESRNAGSSGNISSVGVSYGLVSDGFVDVVLSVDNSTVCTVDNGLCASGDGSPWASGSGVIYNTTASVGIGTSTPTYPLSVLGDGAVLQRSGNANAGWNVEGYSDSITEGGRNLFDRAGGTVDNPTNATNGMIIGSFLFRGHDGSGFSNVPARITVKATENFNSSNKGTEMVFETANNGAIIDLARISIVQGETVINEDSDDQNFRIEGDTNSNLFFVDASTDRVGIGTSSPLYNLEVQGDAYVDTTINVADSIYLMSTAGGRVGIGTSSPDENLHLSTASGVTRFLAESFVDSTPSASQFKFQKARGTRASPETLQDGDSIAQIRYFGYNGTTNEEAVRIVGVVGGNTGTGVVPGRLDFFTADSNGALRDRLNIFLSETVINDDGRNVDFRVEGDTDANLIFADASTNRVGIGTSSPSSTLDVIGSVEISDLAGSYTGGSAYACVYNNGTLFASESACP